MNINTSNQAMAYFNKLHTSQPSSTLNDNKVGKGFSDTLTISKQGMAASSGSNRSKAEIEAKKIADTIKEIERGAKRSPNVLFPGELVPRQINIGATLNTVKETSGLFDMIKMAKSDGVITQKEQVTIDDYRNNKMGANDLKRENMNYVHVNKSVINEYMDKIQEHYTKARDEFDPNHEQARAFDDISNVEIKNNIESKFYSLLKEDPKTLNLMDKLGIERPPQVA